jgi:hypothetical protein
VGEGESGRARVDRSHLQCTINTACHKRTMPRAHISLISLSVTPRIALSNVLESLERISCSVNDVGHTRPGCGDSTRVTSVHPTNVSARVPPPMCRSVPPGVAFHRAQAPKSRLQAAHAVQLRLSRRAASPVRGRHIAPIHSHAAVVAVLQGQLLASGAPAHARPEGTGPA